MDDFNDSTLLIVGGTGSFGNAVLQGFLKTGIKEIRIFSRDEKKQEDMRINYGDEKLKFYVGDVRDYGSVYDAMFGVDYVFNAAALKQVPTCEFFPIEALKTNVLGTNNVLEAAINHKVKRVIVLSTDKAAYPINAMGMTKALMEKVAVAKGRETKEGGTIICRTRYGNVMGSRGSVIPLFLEQIRHDLPITITNAKMTRFMMSLQDAVDLVIYAFKNGHQGDLFVQKSPAATIGDLATAIIALSKKKVDIKEIGIRHGEKMYETLVTREEMASAVDMGEYYKIESDKRTLNYAIYEKRGNSGRKKIEEYNSNDTRRLTVDEIMQLLLRQPFMSEYLNEAKTNK